MKFTPLLLTLALALPALAAHADSSQTFNDPHTGTHPDADYLSSYPAARVEDGVCSITGAIWDGGPVAGAKMQLVEQGGAHRVVDVQTDSEGIYTAAVPVDGKTVFVESIPRSARRVLTGSRIAVDEWTSPKVVCAHEPSKSARSLPLAKMPGHGKTSPSLVPRG